MVGPKVCQMCPAAGQERGRESVCGEGEIQRAKASNLVDTNGNGKLLLHSVFDQPFRIHHHLDTKPGHTVKLPLATTL